MYKYFPFCNPAFLHYPATVNLRIVKSLLPESPLMWDIDAFILYLRFGACHRHLVNSQIMKWEVTLGRSFRVNQNTIDLWSRDRATGSDRPRDRNGGGGVKHEYRAENLRQNIQPSELSVDKQSL